MKKTQAVRAVAASHHPREVDDAIAFLHSIIDLLDARGLEYVDDQFALTMTGMAAHILSPGELGVVTPHRTKAIDDAHKAITAVAALLEESRIPTSVLKGAVAMIETTIRAKMKMKPVGHSNPKTEEARP